MTMNDTSSVDDVENLSSMTLNDASRIRGLLNEGRTTLNDGSTAANRRHQCARLQAGPEWEQRHQAAEASRNLGLLTLNGSVLDPREPRPRTRMRWQWSLPLHTAIIAWRRGSQQRHPDPQRLQLDQRQFRRGVQQRELRGRRVHARDRLPAEAPEPHDDRLQHHQRQHRRRTAEAGSTLALVASSPASVVRTQTGANVYGNTPDDCHFE